MKVSVIIPIYNVEEYLRECIDSVINQTYKNIEILLINDGSPDISESICLEYCNKYSNIKYFYQENQGVSVARNLGISKATGEYLYCLDSDDKISETFIEESLKTAIENTSDLVIVATNVFKRTNYASLGPSEMFIKKQILDENPEIRFPVGMICHEDQVFSNMLFAVTDKIIVNYDTVYFYRQRIGQCSNNITKNINILLNSLKIGIPILLDFYKNRGFVNTDKEKFFYRFIITDVIPWLWILNFDIKQKIFFYKFIHSFMDKDKAVKYNYDNLTIGNKMAIVYIKCPSWLLFEPILVFIKLYRKIRSILFKNKNPYNL